MEGTGTLDDVVLLSAAIDGDQPFVPRSGAAVRAAVPVVTGARSPAWIPALVRTAYRLSPGQTADWWRARANLRQRGVMPLHALYLVDASAYYAGFAVETPPLGVSLLGWLEATRRTGLAPTASAICHVGVELAFAVAALHALANERHEVRVSADDVRVGWDGVVVMRGTDSEPIPEKPKARVRLKRVPAIAPDERFGGAAGAGNTRPVFDIGVILAMLLANDPFPFGPPPGCWRDVDYAEAVRAAGAPAPLADVIAGALAADPAARPSLGELAQQLTHDARAEALAGSLAALLPRAKAEDRALVEELGAAGPRFTPELPALRFREAIGST